MNTTARQPRQQRTFDFDTDHPAGIEPGGRWPGGKHVPAVGVSTRDQPDGRIQGVDANQTKRAMRQANPDDIPF